MFRSYIGVARGKTRKRNRIRFQLFHKAYSTQELTIPLRPNCAMLCRFSSAFVLELLPSPSSRSGTAELPELPQLEQTVAVRPPVLFRSSSRYRHSSFSSKLSRISSCCLSSSCLSFVYNSKTQNMIHTSAY